MDQSAFLTKYVITGCLDWICELVLANHAAIREAIGIDLILVLLKGRFYLVGILIRLAIVVVVHTSLFQNPCTLFLFSFIFNLLLMPRFVVRAIVNVDAAVTIWAIPSLKIWFAQFWIMVDSSGRSQERRSRKRTQRTFESLRLQLFLRLRYKSGISLFTPIYFRIKFPALNSFRYFLFLLCCLQSRSLLGLIAIQNLFIFLALLELY